MSQIIHTNYGDYIEDAACLDFVKQNKKWRNDDPIGFSLELVDKFGIPPVINKNDLIEKDTINDFFDEIPLLINHKEEK